MLFNALFTTTLIPSELEPDVRSLTLSKTTTVSLIEYPTTVKTAATNAVLISREKGNTSWRRENNPSTIITSWKMAIKAPNPNCHLRNLNAT